MPPSSTGSWTRESYLARVSDLLTRSGTADAGELVRLLELNLPAHLKLDAEDQLAEARALMKLGRKIEAIKIVREKTGLGLKEAKDMVETPGFENGPTSPHAPPAAAPANPMDDPRMGEVRALVTAGQLINAIKRYRELTGAGLLEAKNAVEAMQLGGVR